jgi:A/G-specific adenine glycosylase
MSGGAACLSSAVLTFITKGVPVAASSRLALRVGGFCGHLGCVTRHRRKISAIVSKLLEWYPKNARDLPWRRTNDPYCVFVSEIMLQQTQVRTVIPYWQRWMRKLPDAQSLARARPGQVLKLWEGLGYYNRARNLHKAAQWIVREHGGHFPRIFDEVLALPGVGRYTAGAICSIAFNQPTPVLDGNVTRVLTRIFGIAENPRDRKTGERLWELAGLLVRTAAGQRRAEPDSGGLRRASRPGDCVRGRDTLMAGGTPAPLPAGSLEARNCSDLNQALMELGAVICTPRQPKCPDCPVRKQCMAFRQGRTDELPNLGKRSAATRRDFVAFVVQHRDRFLVRQRPAGVVNGRLWEFPNAEVDGGQLDERRLAEIVLGSRPVSVRPLHQIRHTITRYRITLDVFDAEFANGPTPLVSIPRGRWCSPAELRRLAFPSAHRKIVQMLPKRITR